MTALRDDGPPEAGDDKPDPDVTRALQRMLLDERTWLRAMIDHVPDYLFAKDTRSRFVIANTAVATDLGLGNPAAVIGKTDLQLPWKEKAGEYVDHERVILETGVPMINRDEFAELPSGKRLWLSQTKIALRDTDGTIIGLVGIARDITERKQAEFALEASEAMFRGLLDASPDATLVLDGAGVIQFASRRAAAVFGHAVDTLVGRSLAGVVPERLLAAYAERLHNLEQPPSRPGLVEELFALRADGSEFPVEISASPQLTHRGEMTIVSIRDVTERRAVETQLRQAQKMEAIGSLTGGLAHDFNNLLGVVIGSIDLMRERLASDPEADELAGEALAAALSGADLTRRLLAFARRQPLQPRRIDVNELVAGITKLMSRTLPGNLEITREPGADVWPVVADPAQLEAALVNIMANARDAMPEGGKLAIATGNRHLDDDYVSLHPGLAPGDYSLIELTDSGTGMSAETLARIFEPFFTTKEQGKGTGLGLAMVFGFMKQSGGHVNVYSELGAGTTFRLYLPRADAATSAETAAATTIVAPRRGGTVLAVEDNSTLRALVVRQLTQLGYRVLEAADGPSALLVLQAEKVDVLFTDIIMPGGMSGYDLAEAVLDRWPSIKVVLTSGFPEDKLNSRGQRLDGVQLLNKPYRKDDLAAAMRAIIENGGH